jgi:hypothetical protein
MHQLDKKSLRKGIIIGLGSQGIWTPNLENTMYNAITERLYNTMTKETVPFEKECGLIEDILDAMIEHVEMKRLKVKSFPADDSCTIEYNKGFEDGANW